MYFPGVYVPAALGIFAARSFHSSPMGMLFAARFGNALFFVLIFRCILRLVPQYAALFAAVALMPMTLHQVASASADAVTITLSLLGFALLLRTRECKLRGWQLGITGAVIVVMVLCKNSYWALPLLLLIPTSQFRNSSWKLAFIGLVVVASVGLAALWARATREASLDSYEAALTRGIDPKVNLARFVAHPFKAFRDLSVRNGSHYRYVSLLTRQFVGVFGWEWVASGAFWRLLYLAMLLLVASLGTYGIPFVPAERLLLAAVFVGAAAATFVLLYTVDGTMTQGRFTYWSAGVQGRYFIPYSLAGLLAMGRRGPRLPPRFATNAVLVTAGTVGMVSLKVINDWYFR
jgi:uncharacterized membrane protein